MEVLVEYEYEAQEPDELTLRKGDRLTNVTQALEGWFTGTLGNKTGLFPDNFVKVISAAPNSSTTKEDVFEDSPVQLRQKKPVSGSKNRRLKVLFSYAAEQDDELSLEVNDIIDFISEVEDGWYKGSLKGQTGIFPSNFVTDAEASTSNGPSGENKKTDTKLPVKSPVPLKVSPDVVPVEDRKSFEDEPAPQLPPKPVRELAQCFYPYVALNEDELTLNEGDIVTIVSKYCEDDGWWRGELRGKIGLFPDNFVKIISAKDAARGAVHSSAQSQPKIFAQGRNSTGNIGGDIMGNVQGGTTPADSVDGGASSKSKAEQSVKKSPAKSIEAKDTSSKETKEKHSSGSGFSIASFLGGKSKKSTSPSHSHSNNVSTENDSVADFSAVERNERLNHLTANRAKPPRRRPPSTLITRDTDSEFLNGSTNSPDSSFDFNNQSSPSLPLNATQNGGSPTLSSFHGSFSNASTGMVSDTSALSTPNNRYSFSRENDTPATANGTSSPLSTSAQSGKQAKVPPWMAELKQTQDKKKAQATSPVIPSPTSTTAHILAAQTHSGTSPAPPVFTSTPVAVSKEPSPLPPGLPPVSAKAPPLPAKPTVPEKVAVLPPPCFSNNNGIGSGTSPVQNSGVSAVSLKFGGGRKTPTNVGPPPPASNHTSSASITMSSHIITNNNHHNSSSVDGIGLPIPNHNNSMEEKTSKRNSLKTEFVTYEEYSKLQDRVHVLESELEAVKKQLKIYIDKEISTKGHVV